MDLIRFELKPKRFCPIGFVLFKVIVIKQIELASLSHLTYKRSKPEAKKAAFSGIASSLYIRAPMTDVLVIAFSQKKELIDQSEL